MKKSKVKNEDGNFQLFIYAIYKHKFNSEESLIF